MDDVDLAQDVEQREREALIGRHGKRQRHSPVARIRFCVNCGGDIPVRRQGAVPGTDRCAVCQSIREAIREAIREGNRP